MKKLIALFVAVCLTVACTAALAADVKTIKVGASPSPHAEILGIAKPALEELGYKLEIVEFQDYVMPNTALEDGELDANYFQHIPYLTNFNAEQGTHLVVGFGVHLEPMLLFGGKSNDLSAIKKGATIAVPNDPTNEARALRLLQAQGIITLKADAQDSATKLDITENPYDVKISEVEAAQVPRYLADVDFAVVNVNYALSAGLAAADALAAEPTEDNPNVNIVAVREGDEEAEFTLALKTALQSEAVKTYIEETYKGAVIVAF